MFDFTNFLLLDWLVSLILIHDQSYEQKTLRKYQLASHEQSKHLTNEKTLYDNKTIF